VSIREVENWEFAQIIKTISKSALSLFSQHENSATRPRQRRGGYQPGATPRVSFSVVIRPEWAEGIPASLQGAPQSIHSKTQGVALG